MELSNWYIGVTNRYNGVRFVVLEEGLEHIFTDLKKNWKIYIVKKNNDNEIWTKEVLKYDSDKEIITTEINNYKLGQPYNELQLTNLKSYFS